MKFKLTGTKFYDGRDIHVIRDQNNGLWFKINQVNDAMNYAPGSITFMLNFTLHKELRGKTRISPIQHGKLVSRTNHIISEEGVRLIAEKNNNPDAVRFIEFVAEIKKRGSQ